MVVSMPAMKKAPEERGRRALDPIVGSVATDSSADPEPLKISVRLPSDAKT